jgi:hypothetical protein
MKKQLSTSGIIAFVTGAMFAILLICAFCSCSAVRETRGAKPEGDTRGSFWYGKRAEGVKFHPGRTE